MKTMQTNRTEFNCWGLGKYRIHVCAGGWDSFVATGERESNMRRRKIVCASKWKWNKVMMKTPEEAFRSYYFQFVAFFRLPFEFKRIETLSPSLSRTLSLYFVVLCFSNWKISRRHISWWLEWLQIAKTEKIPQWKAS